MPRVVYDGQSYECGEQSVLDCLTAHGVHVPSSCRSGLCETCMMQVVSGKVPARAQAGLKDTLVAQNCFLPCVCHPEEDIEVAFNDSVRDKQQAVVTAVERLSADILGIRLKPSHNFAYRAGQFISFYKDEDTVRCYSLASVPDLDKELWLHVRRVPGGEVSGWMFEHLKAGDAITISDAAGECFYVPGKPDQSILLIGTGSGLAPLYGIVRDALRSGHSGKISLYHGSYTVEGLYLEAELRRLADEHANFNYIPCISDGEPPPSYARGMVLDVVLADNPSLSGWRVFLCGNPNMVKAAQQKTFLAGASMSEILADPFG